MRAAWWCWLTLWLLPIWAPGQLRANELVADLSQHLIAITTAFVGSEVVLFGTTDGTGEIAVLLEGPRARQTVWRKERIAGIWLNSDRMRFRNVPSYYALASTAPMASIAEPELLDQLELGPEHLRLQPPPEAVGAAEVADFRAALIRNKQQQRLYSAEPGEVRFLGPRLFRTTFRFPANVSPGLYKVQVLQFKDGQVVGAQRSTLVISKVGFEADIYDFAYTRPMVHGLIAVLLAVTMGWLAGILFRRA